DVAQPRLSDIGNQAGTVLPHRSVVVAALLNHSGFRCAAGAALVDVNSVVEAGLIDLGFDQTSALDDGRVVAPATDLIDEGPLAGAATTVAVARSALINAHGAATCCLVDLSATVIETVLFDGHRIEAARCVDGRPDVFAAALFDGVVVIPSRGGDACRDIGVLVVALFDHSGTEITGLLDVGVCGHGSCRAVSQGDTKCQCGKFHIHGIAPLRFHCSALWAKEMASHGRPV